jgi:hypothetical protein
LAVLLALACGGGGTPGSSTPPVTVPTPTPVPTPVAGDPFYDASCKLGEGDPNASCERTSERMLNVYEDALDQLIQEKPAIFDLNDEAAPGTKAYRVKDKDAYMNGIVAVVRGRGLCAERDPDDGQQETVRMKLGNDFSESFDALLASGHMRRGGGAYRDSCTPAAFPAERSGDVPPIGSGCGRPYPPPVTRLNCKVHTKGPEYFTLDSTPIVGHDLAYCTQMGYTGISLCPVRPYGWADKEACENWRVGKAQDSGRPGPTWRRDGQFCTGKDSGCLNHPDNQYGLWAYTAKPGGVYTVTAANGASCTVDPF